METIDTQQNIIVSSKIVNLLRIKDLLTSDCSIEELKKAVDNQYYINNQLILAIHKPKTTTQFFADESHSLMPRFAQKIDPNSFYSNMYNEFGTTLDNINAYENAPIQQPTKLKNLMQNVEESSSYSEYSDYY